MSLKSKIVKIYETVDYIEKKGVQSGYNYVRAADVMRVIRQKFIELGIAAQINFFFEGIPFTIARAKAPDAPFNAERARCVIELHDTETDEVWTISGIGTGADMSDKAIYKAQTGALKYALRSAALAPDEAGDPEADYTTNNDDAVPEYTDFRGTEALAKPEPVARPTPAQRKPKATAPSASVADVSAPTTDSAPVAEPRQTSFSEPPPAAEFLTEREPGDDTETISEELPTDAELKVYVKRFQDFSDQVILKGNLKHTAKGGLNANRKILTFLLRVTKQQDYRAIPKGNWDDFFQRAEKFQTKEDYVNLVKFINQLNGVEEKENGK